MQRNLLLLMGMVCLSHVLTAQQTFTITADSTRLTGCDSNELIIENHTQGIKGFLYNTGNGRTIFKKGVQWLSDTSWIIGGDTLHTAAWIQGGNRFGATGKLGTLDYDSLKLYTAGFERLGFGPEGDAHFSNNVSIGSALITTAGNLYNTNAVLFRHFTPRYHNYDNTSPFIGRLEDILYNYNSRLNTTVNVDPDGTYNIHIVFPPGEIAPSGITYPSGYMYFSFWNNGVPQSVTIIERDQYGNWTGPSTSTTNISPNGPGLFAVHTTLGNWLTEIKVTIVPQTGSFVNLQNMEYVLDGDDEGLTNPYPYVSKYGDEHIYNFFYLKNAGVDNVRLSPYPGYANYFMNNIGIGTTSPAAQLHTTGSVRFGGLTNYNAPTRVLVTDTAGNVYYRDASTLAANDAVHSSLAVNGPVRAKSLTLQPKGPWPDYVFRPDYRLPRLQEVMSYAKEKGHLPGVPSATEVAYHGMDVGSHEAMLLKKIEELIIYAARQQAETDALRQRISVLEKMMKDKRHK